MGGCLSTATRGAVRPDAAATDRAVGPETPTPHTPPLAQQEPTSVTQAPPQPDAETRRKAHDGAKRVAIAANALARGADAVIVPHPKSAPTLALLNAAVAASPLFAPLSSPERATLLASMHPVTVGEGEVVIRQGEVGGQEFYVLEKGAAVARVAGKEGGEAVVVKEYGPGSSFGELALLYSSPRAATITATSPAKLWVLDAAVYASVRRAAAAAAAARRRALVAAAPLLSVLSDDVRGVVADALERVEYEDGGRVFDAGAAGDAMFFVDEGAVALLAPSPSSSSPPTKLATVAAGGHFGERALVTAEPRSARAVADGYTVLFRLPAAAFERLLGPLPVVWAAEALRRAPALAPLAPAQLAEVAAAAVAVRVDAGTPVFRAGDPGDAFYVVDDGTADVVAPDGRLLASLERGAVFGEAALLDRAPRAATVTATSSPLALLRISAADFEARLGSLATLRTVWRAEALRRVALLAPLTAAERGALAAALVPRAVPPGAAVVTAGDPGDEFYLVESGELAVEDGAGVRIGGVRAGGFFGELALLRHAPRAATVRAVTAAALLALPRPAFEALLGPAKHLLAAAADGYGPRGAPRLADLRPVAHLGAGAFGRVALVVDAGTNRPYALKTLSKPALVAAGLVTHVCRERAVGAECDSPFVVRLIAAYTGPATVHLLTEACMGGELFSVLSGGALPEPSAKFYAACVVLGLAHLHGRDLAWRDLKPENVLLGGDGYARLADFGFARRLAPGERGATLCGTPEYMAPEMVSQSGHTKAVDWWSLGVLIYEMLVGRPPFSGDDRMAMFGAIVAGKYALPRSLSPAAKDIIRRLLATAPASRLGSGRGGAADVQAHPWFEGVDWGGLAARSVRAPWVPPLTSATDASRFGDGVGGAEPEADPEDEAARARYVSTGAFADF